jgi:hypothetical protein
MLNQSHCSFIFDFAMCFLLQVKRSIRRLAVFNLIEATADAYSLVDSINKNAIAKPLGKLPEAFRYF